MKKIIAKGVALAFVGSIFLVGSATAYSIPFASTGMVNQNYENSWDSSTLSGTALYSFYIDDSDVQVNSLAIEFEKDVFDISLLDAGDFTMVSPADWVTFTFIGFNFNDLCGIAEFSISYNDGTGTPMTSTNDPIQLTVDYTLSGSDRYANANGGDALSYWDWDEGQAWGQGYTLGGKVVSGAYSGCDATSGGSTAPVPEPATMFLFGSGLVGIAGLGRKKIVNK